MTKLSEDIEQGLKEAIQYMRGNKRGTKTHKIYVPKAVNVRKVRLKLKLSQEKFAKQYGLSVSSVRDWEQGRRKPERAARVLLRVIEKNPKAVSEALIA